MNQPEKEIARLTGQLKECWEFIAAIAASHADGTAREAAEELLRRQNPSWIKGGRR